ncbi:MAG: hypothetical protein M4579_007411 [Chaenotheca gracillima]|nr:MAG: hypothetical protein M4579_007411 [Chaenotheca gracillima]
MSVTTAQLAAGRNIAPDAAATITQIDDSTVVKSGNSVRLAEAATMRYVAQHTTVPVPRVHHSYQDSTSSKVHIVMDYVSGDTLEEVWPKLQEDEKSRILDQLQDILRQLRSLKGSFIGSIDGSFCEDVLFSECADPVGPFESEKAFSAGMIAALQEKDQNIWVDLVSRMIESTMHGHEIVLTHGDFLPRNILIQGDKVVAILDWEMAGWYPEYWEYCKIMYHPAWQAGWANEKWEERITTPYYTELAVMMHAREIIW